MAIGTLALGIGANTALFSIFSSLILRPLPVRDLGSFTLLTSGPWSYPIWQGVGPRATDLFAGAFAWSPQVFDLSGSGQSDPEDGAYVSGRLFDELGVTARRGRMIAPADVGRSAPDGPSSLSVMASGGDTSPGASDVVGRQLTIQRVPLTVVGVMPAEFFGPDVGRMTGVMVPFGAEPLIRAEESRLSIAQATWLQIMVGLKPGQTLEQANAALRTVQPQMVETATTSRQRNTTRSPRWRPRPATRRFGGSSKRRSSRCWWQLDSCCLWRARTSPLCCSRWRWRAAANSACG